MVSMKMFVNCRLRNAGIVGIFMTAKLYMDVNIPAGDRRFVALQEN